MVDERKEHCGAFEILGKLLLMCDTSAEKMSEEPEKTVCGEHGEGEVAPCVKADTVLLNTYTCDFATHCARKALYYNMGNKRRAHLTHDPVYLSEDVTEGAIYLTRMSEPEAYCLPHDRATNMSNMFVKLY